MKDMKGLNVDSLRVEMAGVELKADQRERLAAGIQKLVRSELKEFGISDRLVVNDLLSGIGGGGHTAGIWIADRDILQRLAR